MRLVLASTSPWRLRMLRDAGLDVSGVAPGVDEEPLVGDGPVVTAALRARAKAEAVATRHPDAWVLGADQVVHAGDEVFGKPRDPVDHLARLRSLRGETHALVTAWSLRGPGLPADGVCTTRMVVRADLTDAELEAYVRSGEGSGCAGGYAAEGQGAFLFRAVEGDWFNVIGLPLLDVVGALRARGWRYGAG
ncbi:MAG: septum formation protein Maf [Alphaproteobacteria bacterium]|nr:septum formation protein Maf [Alphaproteobacteria bacterium]